MFDKISEALQSGKGNDVVSLLEQGINEGVSPIDLLNSGLLKGMDAIGEKWSLGEIFLPQVLVAARALTMGSNYLAPKLIEAGLKPVGKVIIGTVKGDLHDIGKNLVALMLKGKGFEIIDLGTNVSADAFLQAAKEHQDAKFICISALLTTTMPNIKEILELFVKEQIRENYTIAIGGAPVTQSYCDEIGADVYTDDAVQCAERLIQLV